MLRLWEGLGYYRRARQLHKAAQVIVDLHDGDFPRDREAVHALPGVGRYTAGAILSIAFDAREPILEANTIRVFSRLFAFRDDPATSTGRKTLWEAAEIVLPRRHLGAFNQALMELGSEICTPRHPACDACPVAQLCLAKADGLQSELPMAGRKQQLEDVHEAAVVVRRRGRVLLVRRGEGGRWAGLWDFPRFEISGRRGSALHKELSSKVEEIAGVIIEPTEHLTTLRHGVTRFRITLDCHAARYVARSKSKPSCAEQKWVSPVELEAIPLSITGRKLGNLIAK